MQYVHKAYVCVSDVLSVFNNVIYSGASNYLLSSSYSYTYLSCMTAWLYLCTSGDPRSSFVYIRHEHALVNHQWLLRLLRSARLEMQPAKSCVMTAEAMHSTCSQLGIQCDL